MFLADAFKLLHTWNTAFLSHISIDTGFCFVHKLPTLFCTPTLHMKQWFRMGLQNLA
jgi:hypothetical protein